MKWKVRSAFFTKAGVYTFKVDGDLKFAFNADADGYFDVAGTPPSGLGVYANRIDGVKETILIGGISAMKAKP